jgi:hypothetical protein
MSRCTEHTSGREPQKRIEPLEIGQDDRRAGAACLAAPKSSQVHLAIAGDDLIRLLKLLTA